jgi:hypothetical protein
MKNRFKITVSFEDSTEMYYYYEGTRDNLLKIIVSLQEYFEEIATISYKIVRRLK